MLTELFARRHHSHPPPPHDDANAHGHRSHPPSRSHSTDTEAASSPSSASPFPNTFSHYISAGFYVQRGSFSPPVPAPPPPVDVPRGGRAEQTPEEHDHDLSTSPIDMSRPAAVRQQSSPPGSPSGRGNHHLAVGGASQPFASPTSPRSTFLGSFMRTRSRAASVTNAVAGAVRGRVGSPTTEQPNPLGNNDVTRSVSTPAAEPAAPVNIPPVDPALRRTHRVRLVPVLETNRSFSFAPVVRELGVMHVPPGILPSIAAASVTDVGPTVNGRPPPLIIKIGRFTDRGAGSTAPVTAPAPASSTPASAAADTTTPGGPATATSAGANGAGAAPGATASTSAPPAPTPAASAGGGGGDLLSSRAAFKSKVVSRAHAEIWCEPGGKVCGSWSARADPP